MEQLRRVGGVFVLLASVHASAVAQAQLELRHSAPLAGSTLTLEVRGAPPGAGVELFVSSRAARVATPWGVREFDSTLAQSIASGDAGVGGSFSGSLFLAASDAETERHVQALVSPAGASPQYTPAAHLRVLGSRAYVGFQGLASPTPAPAHGGLAILSLVTNEWLATVPYGRVVGPAGQPGGATPVIRSDFGRGVVAPQSDELIVFEPFFGRVVERIAVQHASKVVFSDRGGERAFALEGVGVGAATLRELDLRSSGFSRSLAFAGGSLSKSWTVDAERGLAYFVSAPSASSPTLLRRVDLETLAELAAVTIGPSGSSVTSFTRSDARVLASVSNGTLVRVRETPSGPQVSVSGVVANSTRIEVLPTHGLIAQWLHFASLPGGSLWLEREASSTGALGIGVYNWGGLIDMLESPRGLWAISANSGILSGGYTLAEFDLATLQWTDWNASIYVNTPAAIARLDDASGVRVCIAADGVFGNVIYERPRLYVLSAPGQEQQIPSGPAPTSLRVISVP